MKYQPGSIVWLNRFADRESRQEVPCSGIHLQRVSSTGRRQFYGIRLLLLQQKVHGSTRCFDLRCVEVGMPINRRVAGRG